MSANWVDLVSPGCMLGGFLLGVLTYLSGNRKTDREMWTKALEREEDKHTQEVEALHTRYQAELASMETRHKNDVDMMTKIHEQSLLELRDSRAEITRVEGQRDLESARRVRCETEVDRLKAEGKRE